ncbi:MAG: family 78 glycoside hydrolase catalytic domain [Bacteroidales bacterium]|nr:family 78 glycoside hydrolase catalytic domain [Bacteroidales bacterium]
MKRFVLVCLVVLSALPARAQWFIGCRTADGNGWEETPIFHKTIVLTNSEVSNGITRVDVTSLGYHEVYVNGRNVGDKVLQPAVSQMDKRAMSVSYDISPYLHEGGNDLMLWVGQGWGRVYGTPAAVKVEVTWENAYQDQLYKTRKVIAQTDITWMTSPSGYSYTGSWQPLQFGGERYDARKTCEERRAAVVDIKMRSALMDGKGLDIFAQEFEGNRIIDTLLPVSVTRTDDSTLLLDFGRVLTGWFQADFQPLPSGHEVTMEYLDHLRATPPHTESDYYVSDGSGSDHFTNRFHYHAFRYVRVTGGDIKTARALQISALNPDEAATFECSDPRLNAIHDLIRYTLQCLTLSGYMMDCPHLERMGYGGDGNSSTMTLQTMYDVRDTYHNWQTAWKDAMGSNGSLPYVAPAFPTGGGPYWSGFIIKAAWRTYLNYRDPTLFGRSQFYDMMKKWLNYVKRYSPDGLLQPWPDEGRMWFLGDWLAPDGVEVGGESALFVSNCFIVDCLGDMERMAKVLGHDDDGKMFASWRKRLKTNIHRKFYHPETHTYANGTPLDQSYALLMDIAPNRSIRGEVEERLLADCHGKYNDHIAVGLMGVPIFTEWCIRERQADLMATILRQPDYPGYLHMLNHGATTTWESWGCERDNGEKVVEDRSRVHNCYNGVGIWFYQALAGIRPDPDDPGYHHFFIDPQPVNDIDWVRATKPTQYGTICVEINGNCLKLTVPEGATATVFPGTSIERTVGEGEWTFTF